MAVLLCVVVAALVAGWATGGSLAHLGEVPLRGWPLLLGAALATVVGALGAGIDGRLGDVAAVGGLVAAVVLVGAVLVRNRRIEGVPLIAVGLLLNAVVVAANGAMPVSLEAAARAGVDTGEFATSGDGRHVAADSSTRLRFLGDVMPVPLPLHPEVISAGDVLVAAGAGLLVFTGMRRRRETQANE